MVIGAGLSRMRARTSRAIGLAVFAWLGVTLPSVAAKIELFQATQARTFINVVGDLVPEDSDQFRAKTLGVPSSSATVVFKSDGGSVVAAIGSARRSGSSSGRRRARQ